MDWAHKPLAEAFTTFRARMDLYLEDQNVTDAGKQATKIKIALGDEGMRRILTSGLTDAQAKDPKQVYDLIESQLDPSIQVSFRVHRLEFANTRQHAGETTSDFICRLREKAGKCDFPVDELNERLIEQLVLSTPTEDFRKDLLSKPKGFPIADVVSMGRQYEAIAASQATLQGLSRPNASTPLNVDAVRKSSRSKGNRVTGDTDHTCRNCGKSHKPRQCPAYNDTCDFCNHKGHWKAHCRKRQKHPRARSHSKRGDNHESSTSLSCIRISNMALKSKRAAEAFTTVDFQPPNINQSRKFTLKLKIDTGAGGNTLPYRIFKQIYPSEEEQNAVLKPIGSTRLIAYNEETIPCRGSITTQCRRGNEWVDCEFYVVDVPGVAVAGLPTCKRMNWITIHVDQVQSCPTISTTDDLTKAYPMQFDRVGSFKNAATLHLKHDAEPHIDPPRRFSVNLTDKLKGELDSMCKQNIIRKVSEHSDWCSSLVTTQKRDGSLRVCIDPKVLNTSLKRCPHKIPTVEELNPKFSNAKVFSKLDAKSGYWAVHLDESSQLLTTFRTPFGRYCWKRLPFGLTVSQDIFQARMDDILEGLEGVVSIADDICVFGSTEAEHDERLHRLMSRAAEAGLVFNSSKCQIKQSQISFFGNIYSGDGITADPSKVQSICDIPTPTTKEDLQRFLGMVTYLSPFIPNLANEANVLRGLLKANTPWAWDETHDRVFNRIKQITADSTCLQYYDTTKPVSLEVDASSKGLGAALVQDKGPIAYASKSLTETESRYNNIECECLAVAFGILRYHHYLYGRHFTVITDHKPLEMIFKKPFHSAPPRLQRMIHTTHGYDFEVKYRPGSEMALADTLSRLSPTESLGMIIPCEAIVQEHHLDALSMSHDETEKIRTATQEDPTFRLLSEVIYSGWPETRKELTPLLRDFWAYRDELGMEDGVLVKGRQVVIPEKLRPSILQRLHEGHQGIEKTRRLARECVYWPNFNKDVEKICSQCTVCQELQPQQAKEPMQMHDKPNQPWVKLGSDIFTIDGNHYLLISDYHSRYPVVKRLESLNAKCTIQKTKEVLAMMGVPREMVSDNGPQFLSEYDAFCEDWGIKHTTSSPRYPQSNGFIERQIRYIKPILKKCLDTNGDTEKALLLVRATPLDSILPSPAEIIFGRPIATTLPSRNLHETPDIHREHMEMNTAAQKRYADVHTKPLRPMIQGEDARVRCSEKKTWFPATVISAKDRSYTLRTPTGKIIRRNRRQIRPTNQPTDEDIRPTNQPTDEDTNEVQASHSPDKDQTSEESLNTSSTGRHVKFSEPLVTDSTTDPPAYTTRYGRTITCPARYRNNE